MSFTRNGRILFLLILGLSLAWGQGGRAGRAAAAQAGAQAPPAQTTAPPAATPPAAAGRGGRGAPIAPATSEFYDYDTSAATEASISAAPPSEAHGKVTVNGEALAYTARAGYLPLHNATTGQPVAHIFYTWYSKDGASDGAARPVMFFLGGAPGVAATWQEFGGLGPKRMKWGSDGAAPSAPYEWADNPHTLLGQADLVFVNPVGTAFSRPVQPSHGPGFWNTAGDIASLGEFVRDFLNTNSRRNSPIFLVGEDHGTGRAAGLAAYLHDHQIPVQGVVLLSLTMSADALAGDTEFLTLMPSLTMAAWHHKKLTPELNAMSAEQVSGQARQFASREYLHALYKGDRMTSEERAKVVADLARLTGLSKAFVVNNDLRVTTDRFNTELLHEQHRGLSASDSRVSGFLPAPAGGGRGFFGGGVPLAIDFNLHSLTPGFQTAYEAYLRSDLKFSGNGIFYLSSGGTGTFNSTGTDDQTLSNAFARDPNLRLFVAIDYFDLDAPFYAAEFTLAHLNVAPEVRSHNITVAHYEAGEMPYLDNKALPKLQADLARFLSEPAAHK